MKRIKTNNAIKSLVILGLSIIAILFTNSCRDEFSEEDALEILSKVDVNFFVYDKSSTNLDPVVGASITIIQSNEVLEETTDENGMAKFSGVSLGTIFYRIEAVNYLAHSGDVQLYNEGGLINQQTLPIGMFNMNDESLASISGRVLIETDLTNDETEFAEGVTLNLRVQVENKYLDFNATTNSEGRYEFKVPAESYGSYSTMRIPDLEILQKIAYNRIAGDDRSFPEIVPKSDGVLTVFSTNTSANRNHNNYPVESVVPYYAIAEPAPDPAETAIVGAVYTDNDGHVTGLGFNYGGNYRNDADGKVRVDVYALGKGSGAYFEFSIDVEFSNLSDILMYGKYVMDGGFDYPNEEYYFNRMQYRAPTPTTSDSREKYLGNIMPGSTTIVNIDYGTGTYRLYDYD